VGYGRGKAKWDKRHGIKDGHCKADVGGAKTGIASVNIIAVAGCETGARLVLSNRVPVSLRVSEKPNPSFFVVSSFRDFSRMSLITSPRGFCLSGGTVFE
jgi:hypothetical protein